MTVLDVEARRAQIESLRVRLASLGGASPPRALAVPAAGRAVDGAPHRTAWVPADRRSAAEQAVAVRIRAERLGFEAEAGPGGTAFVRRASVDLLELLEGAGMDGAMDPGRLVRLGCRPSPEGLPADLGENDVAVLDIETLGLRGSGVLAFLVGLGVPRGDCLQLEQFLLADPEGETALLSALMSSLGRRSLIVTYNGRCFDVPALAARCVVNRLNPVNLEWPLHADLLGPVRRLFRDRLEVCTLRQAEIGLLGFDREGDVPGHEAPTRYRRWLAGAPAAVLEGVVAHNQLDLCTTMVLGARLAAHVEGRLVQPVHPADRYNLGRYMGSDEHLRSAFAAGQEPWSRRAGHRLAVRLARGTPADQAEALAIWQSLWDSRRTDLRAARAVAVRRERCGDLATALDVCHRVHRLCTSEPAEPGSPWRPPRPSWTPEWQKRLARLERRRGRQPGPGSARGRSLEWAAWMTPPRFPAVRG